MIKFDFTCADAQALRVREDIPLVEAVRVLEHIEIKEKLQALRGSEAHDVLNILEYLLEKIQ